MSLYATILTGDCRAFSVVRAVRGDVASRGHIGRASPSRIAGDRRGDRGRQPDTDWFRETNLNDEGDTCAGDFDGDCAVVSLQGNPKHDMIPCKAAPKKDNGRAII